MMMMMIQLKSYNGSSLPDIITCCYNNNNHHPNAITTTCGEFVTKRRSLSLLATVTVFSAPFRRLEAVAVTETPRFSDLAESGGVKVLDIRVGTGIDSPVNGDQVAIHYYGRLAAKQGWRFDSTYDHKDETGEPVPFSFTLGSGKSRS